MANKYDDADGVWRTIGGRRVFIRTGQSLSDAMKESGKFKKKNDKEKELKELNKQADKYAKTGLKSEKQLNIERDAKDLLKQLNDEGSDFDFNEDVVIKDDKLITDVGVMMPYEDGYTSRELQIPLDENETYSSLEAKLRDWQDRHRSVDDWENADFEAKEIDSKSVMDSDGFYTDYTLYEMPNGKYKAVFGDKEVYGADADADMEFDTKKEAQDWFRNYKGFDDEEDKLEALNKQADEYATSGLKTQKSINAEPKIDFKQWMKDNNVDYDDYTDYVERRSKINPDNYDNFDDYDEAIRKEYLKHPRKAKATNELSSNSGQERVSDNVKVMRYGDDYVVLKNGHNEKEFKNQSDAESYAKTLTNNDTMNKASTKTQGKLQSKNDEFYAKEDAYMKSVFGENSEEYKNYKKQHSEASKTTNETMNNAIREKATKKSTFKDDLPKHTEIKTQGTSNRKEVSENIQAHILDYYDSPQDFLDQMDAMDYLPTRWKQGEELAKGGSYLIYNGDMSDFLNELKINPKGKTFSEDKAFDMYTSLVGRESAKLYDRLMKNEFNKYKQSHPLTKMTLEEFKKSRKK